MKKQLIAAAAALTIGLGFGASSSYAALKTVHTDSVKVTSKTDYKGSSFKSNGGSLQIQIPAHSQSKNSSSNPRLYISLYKKDKNGKKVKVTTWTDSGKNLKKLYTCRTSSAPKGTVWVEYDASYTGSFKAKVLD